MRYIILCNGPVLRFNATFLLGARKHDKIKLSGHFFHWTLAHLCPTIGPLLLCMQLPEVPHINASFLLEGPSPVMVLALIIIS